jgi:hypothetical protein
MALIAILTALIARDLGGPRRAQILAAIIVALSGYLAAGHLDSTAAVDLLAWAIIVWLLVKLLAGGDRRLWLALGVSTGIGLENKDTPSYSSVRGWLLASFSPGAGTWCVRRGPGGRSGSRCSSGRRTSPGRPRTASRN